MKNVRRATTAEGVRHQKNFTAKDIPATEITAREQRKRMATAKKGTDHGR